MDLLDSLAIGATPAFAGLLVISRPFHLGPDATTFDQLFESLEGLINGFIGPQPHLQHSNILPLYAYLVRECTYISAVKSEGNSGFEKKGPSAEDFAVRGA